jgi:galactitol-specific phosphotransferase system IIB component
MILVKCGANIGSGLQCQRHWVEKVNAKKIELTANQVKQKVRTAIELLIRKDAHLLKIDVNERSITHRLALHLQDAFKGWDVDCEYNRNRYDTKKLFIGNDVRITVETIQSDDEQGKTVYPDIIVHHRDTDQNLLVVEVKKTTSHVPKNFDLDKLREYKRQLGYSHSLFLSFVTGSPEKIEVEEEIWIDDGG